LRELANCRETERREADAALARRRRKKSSSRWNERQREKREEDEPEVRLVHEKHEGGYKHSRAWSLPPFLPSFSPWGKAPGYDSFPWSVKRLREHTGGEDDRGCAGTAERVRERIK